MTPPAFSHIRGLLFDVDNTLYPKEKGVFDRINSRIERYVQACAGLSLDEGRRLRRAYVEAYGTTLGGLVRHHRVDPDEYLDFVHRVPVESLLEPDPEAADLLARIDLPMAILTNATIAHARRVLTALGIDGFFDAICDLAATGYLGKPDPAAYRAGSDLLSLSPERILFVDDLARNLDAAAAAGMTTILMGSSEPGNGHFQVADMGELAGLLAGADWYRA